MGVVIFEGEGSFGDEFGHIIVTIGIGDFATRLFPNYFVQDLFLIFSYVYENAALFGVKLCDQINMLSAEK